MRTTHALSIVLATLIFGAAWADVVDAGSDPPPVLGDIMAMLDDVGVDVLYDHASDVGQGAPSFGDKPRVAPLIGFSAWPGIEVDMQAHGEWMQAFEDGARGAIAAAPTEGDDTRPSREVFERIWGHADDGERIVITFDAADIEVAERVSGVLEAVGYAVYLAIALPEQEPVDPAELGALFVEADHVFVIDTASARLNSIIQFEAELLAELKRQREWVASGDDGLPPIKRGSMDVVESLGVLPMEVLPGGIVLGVEPTIDESLEGATFVYDGSEYGFAADGNRFIVEQVSEETREAIRGFVGSDSSHSVIDIAGGEVTLTDSFKRTRIGSRMEDADRTPFRHLSINDAQKSLIVDKAIEFRRTADNDVDIDVTLEVRFYRRNGEGNADRLATIEFMIEDVTSKQRIRTLTWSTPTNSGTRFQGSNAEDMAENLEQLALDAALIAVQRLDG